MAAAEPIRNRAQVRQLAEFYLRRGQLRNYILIVIGVHTALRISDLLRLRWCDIYDFNTGAFRKHFRITEKKTGKIKTIALNREVVIALKSYFSVLADRQPDIFLFRNNRKNGAAISRVQAYRIIRAAAESVGVESRVSCHSLRKTFGYHAWKSGVHAAVIMDIYNHSSFAVTRRYLGVCQDDRDKVYMNMHFL